MKKIIIYIFFFHIFYTQASEYSKHLILENFIEKTKEYENCKDLDLKDQNLQSLTELLHAVCASKQILKEDKMKSLELYDQVTKSKK